MLKGGDQCLDLGPPLLLPDGFPVFEVLEGDGGSIIRRTEGLRSGFNVKCLDGKPLVSM